MSDDFMMDDDDEEYPDLVSGMLNSTECVRAKFCRKASLVHVFLFRCRFCCQEYSEESNSEPDVDLENQYYNSKSIKESDPRAALKSFQSVSNTHWPFFSKKCGETE